MKRVLAPAEPLLLSIPAPPGKVKHDAWGEAVARAAMQRSGQMLRLGQAVPAPPYLVALVFAFSSLKRAGLDKLTRATIDGLVRGGLLLDRRHIASLRAVERRMKGAGGVQVAITTAPESVCPSTPPVAGRPPKADTP